MSPVFVPAGDLDVPAGFSKTGDTLLTHLYNQLGVIKNQIIPPDALYLLKYALFITVTQMLKNQKLYLTYIDEIALTSLIERTTLVLNKPIHTKTHEDLGFSVSMSFQAKEKSSYEALNTLLHLAQ